MKVRGALKLAHSAETIYFPTMWEVFKILCAVPTRNVDADGIFSSENGSTIGSVLVAITRDRLWKLAVIAKHSHVIPISRIH